MSRFGPSALRQSMFTHSMDPDATSGTHVGNLLVDSSHLPDMEGSSCGGHGHVPIQCILKFPQATPHVGTSLIGQVSMALLPEHMARPSVTSHESVKTQT